MENSSVFPKDIIEPNIHMIWFGDRFDQQPQGVAEVKPGAYLERLQQLAAINPSYEVYLWTDQTTYEVLDRTKLSEEYPNLHIKNFMEEPEFALSKSWKAAPLLANSLKKIEILCGNNPAYPGHNYGAAGDIARVLILYKHGGIYLDTDTTITKQFPEVISVSSPATLLLGRPLKDPEGDLQQLSTDIIAAPKNCPKLKLYLQLVDQYMSDKDLQYITLTITPEKDPRTAPKLVHSIRNAMKSTTELFGPQLTRFCATCDLIQEDSPQEYIATNIANMANLKVEDNAGFFYCIAIQYVEDYLGEPNLPSYEAHAFRSGYTERGQHNTWLLGKEAVSDRLLARWQEVQEQSTAPSTPAPQ